MSGPQTVDGLLLEWGARLFIPHPRKARKSEEPPAFGLAIQTLARSGMRNQLARAVAPRSHQVMVKITGGGRGMRAIEAHLRYISRQGKDIAGGRGQTLELETERGERLQGREDVRDLAREWRVAGSYIEDVSPRREAFHIILSMPAGTPPELVRDAARDFAKETFAGHRYVFVLHEDTDSPHVHLAVRAEGDDGHRLNPRKADLALWRIRFAQRLQDRGINAIAMRAAARGPVRRPTPQWRRHAPERRVRVATRSTREDAKSQVERREALHAWEQVTLALVRMPDPRDRTLGLHVLAFVSQAFDRSREALPPREGPQRVPGADRTAPKAQHRSDSGRSREVGTRADPAIRSNPDRDRPDRGR